MSVFSEAEIAYLNSQRLGRLATVGPNGQPHVVPVSFRYNPEMDTVDIGGHGFVQRKKYRDVQRNPWVAFVVDDIASLSPWRVRGIEIRGRADILGTGGKDIMPSFDDDLFRVHPSRIVSWGVDNPDAFIPSARSV